MVRGIVTAKGRTFVTREFDTDLSLNQVINATKGLSTQREHMLTLQKAMGIRADTELSTAVKSNLKPYEWTYLRDEKSESNGLAACLILIGEDGWFYAGSIAKPCDVSRVVVLEKTGIETATTPIQNTLRE